MAESKTLSFSTDSQPKELDLGDGQTYRMADADSLSLRQSNVLKRMSQLAQEWAVRDLSDSELDDLEERLDAAMRLIVPDLEQEKLASLGMQKRARILAFFMKDEDDAPGEAEAPEGAQES